MPSASASEVATGRPCSLLMACWAEESGPSPVTPVRANGKDTMALVDSGSMVTLIAMDQVGPLAKSNQGHQYILVILDYATKYPEAILMCTMATEEITCELVMLFSRVGIPDEILTDQGTPFMLQIMKDLYK